MKVINFTMLILIFEVVSCQAQNQLKECQVPFLLNNIGRKERLVIKDHQISDSLKVIFQVIVKLESPLRDTTKIIKVQSVDILRILAVSLSNHKTVLDFSYRKEKGTLYQNYIWNICSRNFVYWYENQLYGSMIDKKQWGDRLVLGGTLYILPN